MLRAQREGGPRGFAHSWDLTRFASSLFPADCIALPAGGRRSRYTWCDLLEQFQEFAAQAVFDTHETGGVAARPRQAGNETGADLDRRSWRWMALTGDPMATAGSIVRESTEREALEQLSDGEILRRAVIERGAGEGARPRSAALWLKFPGNLQIACKLIGSPAATCLRQGFGTPSAALTEFSHARAVTPAVVQPAACATQAAQWARFLGPNSQR
jgi:hypothetical protein